MDKDELYTPSEAAKILKVSRTMIYYLVGRGKIRGYKARGMKRMFLVRKDVEEMASGKVTLEREGG